MSKQMSETLIAAAQESEIITRMLLTIYTPDNTYRFVANDNADLTMPDGTVYMAAEIKRGEIETSTDGDKEGVSLELSNRWQEWAAYMANNGKKLKGCVCEIVDVFVDHLEEGPVWRFKGKMDNLSMVMSTFTCNVIRDTVNYSAEGPVMDYGPTCQFTFGDSRCRSTNPNGPCDQTATTCEALGNITRYQGHLSIADQMVMRNS